MPYRGSWAKSVDKQLLLIPSYIRDKFLAWVIQVEILGVYEARKGHGYHDEPLKGKLAGRRSIRLNRAYRVVYVELKIAEEVLIRVLGVTKHEY